MSGQNNLHIRIQFTNQADETLLPFHMKGDFGFVHKEHTTLIVLHQYGQQYNQQLFFTR